MNKKIKLGQFNTVKSSWLTDEVIEFIEKSNASICLDPFAGNGDILNQIKNKFGYSTMGYDIDDSKEFPINDSLLNIPKYNKDVIIITNPPYLTKGSAKRKGLNISYFEKYNDLYLLAIEKCLESCESVVAIIPETFLSNVKFFDKHIESITIIEDDIFEDTSAPVCVACLSQKEVSSNFKIYYQNFGNIHTKESYDDLRNRFKSNYNSEIKFNNPTGNIALIAVDGVKENDRIRFLNPNELKYKREIKGSSRLITIIQIENIKDVDMFCDELNEELEMFRGNFNDIIFSSFKGNNKIGKRRRRMDYKFARDLINYKLGALKWI